MQIETSRFGPVELDENLFIHFPWGIAGSENARRYFLMQHRDGPFQWLQAVDVPELAFVVCPPEALGVRYEVPGKKTEPIRVKSHDELVILVMVSINREDKTMRPHFRGPLLFNSVSREAYQWVMEPWELDKRLRLLPDETKQKEASPDDAG